MVIEKHLRILAINPGRRYLGIAFFIDSDLKEWRLKGLDAKGESQKTRKMIRILSELVSETSTESCCKMEKTGGVGF